MKRKNILAILCACLMAGSLAACNGNSGAGESSPAGGASVSSSAAGESSKPTKDRGGNPITLPDQVDRIISMAPATTQLLCDLGLQDKIIAVDTNSKSYVSGMADDLLEFDMMNPDTEKMIHLKPDLVFTSGMSNVGGDDAFKTVKDVGICVASIPSSSSIADVKLDVQFTADCVGRSAEGKAIVEAMQKDIDAIATIGKTITNKKTVLFEIAAAPSIYSFGKNTFLQEMLELIGAENIFGDQESWISVTEEAAIGANPDVILTSVNYLPDPVGEIKARNGWEEVAAVKNGQVYAIDNGASSLPNQHIVDALKQMAKAIYPEQYAFVVDPFAEK